MDVNNIKKVFDRNRSLFKFLISTAILLAAGYIIITIIRNNSGLKLGIINSHLFYSYSRTFIITCHKILLLFSYPNDWVLLSMTNHEYVFEICLPQNKCLFLGWPCYGVKITAVFIILVLVFPGKVKHKLWYIPFGILLIQFFNILRFSLLAIFLYHHSVQSIVNFEFLNLGIGYHELFNFVLYIFIFLTFVVWVRKFSAVSNLSRRNGNAILKEKPDTQE